MRLLRTTKYSLLDRLVQSLCRKCLSHLRQTRRLLGAVLRLDGGPNHQTPQSQLLARLVQPEDCDEWACLHEMTLCLIHLSLSFFKQAEDPPRGPEKPLQCRLIGGPPSRGDRGSGLLHPWQCYCAAYMYDQVNISRVSVKVDRARQSSCSSAEVIPSETLFELFLLF